MEQARSYSTNQSLVSHLENQGLLVNVFNQLRAPEDFVSCAAVSWRWHTLVQEARPTFLEIGISSVVSFDANGATGLLQWMQKKQQQGLMQSLRCFELCAQSALILDYESQARLQCSFCDAVVTFTGFWNLHTCILEGFFCLQTAAALLPTALKKLELTVHEVQDDSHLWWFERLQHLQLLYVNLYDLEEQLPCDRKFMLDGIMPSLRELNVEGRFYCSYDDVPGAESLSECFPNIQQLHLLVPGDNRASGLITDLFHLKTLDHLRICIFAGPAPWVHIDVPGETSVSVFRLVAPKVPEVALTIRQVTGFVFECPGVPHVSMPVPSCPMKPLQLV